MAENIESCAELVDTPGFTEETDGNKADKEGCVYAIKEVDSDVTGFINYKVGRTENLDERLKKLKTANPRELVRALPEVKVKNMRVAEKTVHNALNSYRCPQKGGTEWYKVPLDQEDRFLEIFTQTLTPYQA